MTFDLNGLREPFSRQALPHNFRDLLGKEYGFVHRVSLVEMLRLLESAWQPELTVGRLSLPVWAVVSKSTGAGWHCTTAVELVSGTVYTYTSRVGMAVLFRGIGRDRPGVVLYLERAEQLRADGLVYKCPQPRPVKKQRLMHPSVNVHLAVPTEAPATGLTGLGP